jgi:anthranilate phosphoribosyltransferase
MKLSHREAEYVRLKELTDQLHAKVDLSRSQVLGASEQLASPNVDNTEKAGFLTALRDKGETGEEVGYFAEAFLAMSLAPTIQIGGRPTIDLCGTGGDRLELINVSTTAMFVVAAADVVILKHGNRAITSRSGGADVLEKLGIPVSCTADQMIACIQETGIGFLFAPLYHPAFQLIAPVRKQLAEHGVATIFNLLGPLLNPMRPEFQLVGVFSQAILEKYAIALSQLGRRRAWVIHGSLPGGSGMDEISPLGETQVHEVKEKSFNYFHLFPEQLGIHPANLQDLRGGDAETNAQILEAIVRGNERGARREFVLLNAAAGLVIAGRAPKMESGLQLAADLIDSGKAAAKLEQFRRFFRKAT